MIRLQLICYISGQIIKLILIPDHEKAHYNFSCFYQLLACKKKEFSPEGPTDVRIRNISDLTFEEVIVKTSENRRH